MDKSASRIESFGLAFHSIFVFTWFLLSIPFYGAAMVFVSSVMKKDPLYLLRLWGRHLCAVARITIEIEGLKNIDLTCSYVFIANHASIMDIPILYAILPHDCIFVAKKELFSLPLFGRLLRFCGFIPVDRADPRQTRKAFHDAIGQLRKRAVSVVLFPEGTRSQSGRIRPFKSAGFSLALETGLSMVPVLLVGPHEIMAKKSMILRPGHVVCRIGSPIAVTTTGIAAKKDLAGRLHEALFRLCV